MSIEDNYDLMPADVTSGTWDDTSNLDLPSEDRSYLTAGDVDAEKYDYDPVALTDILSTAADDVLGETMSMLRESDPSLFKNVMGQAGSYKIPGADGKETSLLDKIESFAKENPFLTKFAAQAGMGLIAGAARGHQQDKQMEFMRDMRREQWDREDQMRKEQQAREERNATYAVHKPIQTGLLSTIQQQKGA